MANSMDKVMGESSGGDAVRDAAASETAGLSLVVRAMAEEGFDRSYFRAAKKSARKLEKVNSNAGIKLGVTRVSRLLFKRSISFSLTSFLFFLSKSQSSLFLLTTTTLFSDTKL